MPNNSNTNKFRNIYHVLRLKYNLISLEEFVRHNDINLVFGKETCVVFIRIQLLKFITVGYWNNKSQLYKLT